MELGRTLTIARHEDNTPTLATDPAEYAFVCGGRSRSFDMSANRFDRTVPDFTNPGAPLVKAEGSGIQNRTFQISGLQINNTAGLGMLEDARQARDWYYLISVPGWGDFSGRYNVSITLAGELEGDMTYDASFSLADGATEAFTPEA
ncbi:MULTISPECIES: hypothetical protein [unclassified Mesorhizobium]|uniref:hypothetical protein n=1 Tax=unclassified Mesorhizobium TaxID=325217 RepID=UPI00112BF97C|nr:MULTISPECIES: hypothetical protein [unclassified Mesorhizobium]MCA0027337.1 phage tail protein [Mesorhizobium sp. B263B1A]TPJ98612.1 hypothetical protein FJ489_06705 [Mesorhizobium sp. B2-5-12]TPK28774.1 hypothetical protein FJ562_00095 [Mesorhizobium sp. B2-5-6]